MRRFLDGTHELFQISPELFRRTPVAQANDFAVRVENELGIVEPSQLILQFVFHVVGQPWNRDTSEHPFGFADVQQPLVHRDWIDVAVVFWMRQCFVDEVECNAFRRVVSVDGLQTGDIAKKRWSR